MPSPPRKMFLTPEEYLAIDRASELRYEFYDGEMFPVGDPPRALNGLSLQRNRIGGNLFSDIHHQLDGHRFEVFFSDIRVTLDGNEFAYPDIVIVAGKPELIPDKLDSLLNPQVIIEVLSHPSDEWDWGHRFNRYQQRSSFQQYILIDRDAPVVASANRRSDGQWVWTEANWPDGVLVLDSVGIKVPLRDIYRRVFMPDHLA